MITRIFTATLGASALLAAAAAAEPIVFSAESRAEAAQAAATAFRRGDDTITVAFEQTLTPTELLTDDGLGPWISRIDKTPGRTAALCQISLRRGLTPGQQIAQLAVSGTQDSGASDPYAPAGGFDAFVFFGETRTKKQKVVRLIFTKRSAHGALDCDGAFAVLRAGS